MLPWVHVPRWACGNMYLGMSATAEISCRYNGNIVCICAFIEAGMGEAAFQTTFFQLVQMLSLENDGRPASNFGRQSCHISQVGSTCPKAQQLLQMLPRHRLMSSVISHNCIISACEKTAEWREALAMLCLDEIETRGKDWKRTSWQQEKFYEVYSWYFLPR